MAFRLVIAEKPSMAQTIAAALGIKGKQDGYIEGGGYLISWCVGHLVQLAEAAAYGEQYKKWSFDSLCIGEQLNSLCLGEAHEQGVDVLLNSTFLQQTSKLMCSLYQSLIT